MRPVLARTSSAASGLRFCGMIDEPVVKRSESATKPNCGVAQSTISSAKRERCTAQIEAAESASSAKSRSATEVERVRRRAVEAERLRGRLAVDRERGAGKRRRAERRFVQPLAAIGEAAAVARKHLDIGEEMMAEGDRLRALQMREARHHRVGMSLGLLGQRRSAARCSWPSISSMAFRTQSFRSVATWSLRERAVWSRPAASPISSFSRASTCVWMSSSARENVNVPGGDL